MYFVDATTGTLLWTGSKGDVIPSSGYHETFAKMDYSIPSDVEVVRDRDQYLSQIYVGDMGGQIWRFDINNGAAVADLVDGGVIADFGQDSTTTGARRFYSAPDLSLSLENNTQVLNIAIGSGYRAHPLDVAIDDKFFVFRYPFAKHDPDEYGLEGTDPVTNTGTGVFEPIKIEDLYDTTANVIGQSTNQQEVTDARTELDESVGWYITMEDTGEKILGKSTTLNFVVRFVSYVPHQQVSGSCDPNIGESYYLSLIHI